MKFLYSQRGFAFFGLVMVVATITLVGLVGFRFIAAQNNTEVAVTPANGSRTSDNSPSDDVETGQIVSAEDITNIAAELDTVDIDSGSDAELDAAFNF